MRLRTFSSMRWTSVKSILGYTDGDWFYQCIFTLPTPPMRQNCHSDNFRDQLRAFPLPFGQSPSGLPVTQEFCLMLNGKVDPEQWTISWCVKLYNLRIYLSSCFVIFSFASFSFFFNSSLSIRFLRKERASSYTVKLWLKPT